MLQLDHQSQVTASRLKLRLSGYGTRIFKEDTEKYKNQTYPFYCGVFPCSDAKPRICIVLQGIEINPFRIRQLMLRICNIIL